jgi:hypothetical protein
MKNKLKQKEQELKIRGAGETGMQKAEADSRGKRDMVWFRKLSWNRQVHQSVGQ